LGKKKGWKCNFQKTSDRQSYQQPVRSDFLNVESQDY
jgi:hypothetical protein